MTDDDGLLKPPKSLEPPVRYEIPDDPVGRRPAGEEPQGALQLLWEAIVTVRYRFGKILGFILLGAVVWIGAALVIILLSGYLLRGQPGWVKSLGLPLYWPVTVPLLAGLSYALLLMVQDLGPRTGEIFRPTVSHRLYFNVLLAGIPASVLAWLVGFGAVWLRAWLVEAPPTEPPLAEQSAWMVLVTAVSRFLPVPFAFAALDATVTGSRFGPSIARSLRFARRQFYLLLGFGVIQVLLSVGHLLLGGLMRNEPAWSELGAVGGRGVVWLLKGLVCLGPYLLLSMVSALVHPVFYREFVWREREAAERSVP